MVFGVRKSFVGPVGQAERFEGRVSSSTRERQETCESIHG